jgi:hypothetical protein
MVPLTRILTIAMAAVVCFALLLPLALARHNATLAVFVVAVFVAYLVVNVLLWQRTSRRA